MCLLALESDASLTAHGGEGITALTSHSHLLSLDHAPDSTAAGKARATRNTEGADQERHGPRQGQRLLPRGLRRTLQDPPLLHYGPAPQCSKGLPTHHLFMTPDLLKAPFLERVV